MAFGGYGRRLLTGTEGLAFRHPIELAAYGGLAMLCAGVGLLFYVCLRGFSRLWSKSRLPRAVAPAAAGVLCGLIACGLPQIMDPRYEFIQSAVDGSSLRGAHPWLWWAVLFLLVILGKCVATSAMMGAESAGGLFGPVIFMGGATGAAAGAFVEAFFPGVFPETLREALIPVGMAGALSATLRTPLAAIVMVTEMTGSYGLIVPLMLVSVLAYILGRRWGVYAEQVSGPHESPAHAGESILSLLERWRVKDFMDSRWPHVAPPTATLPELVSRLPAAQHPTFIILDEGGKVTGLVSISDVARAVDLRQASSVILTMDIMAAPPQLVHPENELYETLDIFRRHEVELLPVVEERSGQFIGVLTREAILRGLRGRIAEQRTHLLREHAGVAVIAQENFIESLLSDLALAHQSTVERMPVPSEAAGRTLREVDFRNRYGRHVIAVETASGGTQAPPEPDRPLGHEDVLVVLVERQ
jgi:CIC family chloride channel protein